MITSRLEDRIVFLEIEGEFTAEDLQTETRKWFDTQKDAYIGYLVDISKVTVHPALEQQKAGLYAKQLNSQKPRALVGNSEANARLASIFFRFTQAQNAKYFSDYEEAKGWLHSQAEVK